MLEIDLSGSRALVTGAGQGIGREIALTLAQAGAEVVVNDLVPERCRAVAGEIESLGLSATPLSFDVSNFEEVQRTLGPVDGFDVLVNNAGNRGDGRFELKSFVDSDPGDWEPYMKVNLQGVMVCTRMVLPGMIVRRHGRIITVISDAARAGERKMAAYAAAKAGAAGFIRSVASEVGAFGITAKCSPID
jgi:3-oxoacyl-[acyl-carrier protein] reductase